MAQRYIPENIDRKVCDETVKVQKWIKRPVTQGEVLKLLILKGLEGMKAEDWRRELDR